MGLLVGNAARTLRDEERDRLEAQDKTELARQYDGQGVNRVEVRAGRAYEVLVMGSYDYVDDPTSDFYAWIYVRPRWVSGLPVVRWLLSARGVVIPDD